MNSLSDGQPAASSPAPLDSVTIQQIEEEVLCSLMLVTSLGLFVWYVLANFNVQVGDVVDVSYVLLVAAVFSASAYLLMRSSCWMGAAWVVWLMGFCLTIGLALGVNQLRVAQTSNGTQANTFPYLMAVSTIIALPILLLFFFAQRTFIEGISLTGIKG